MVVPIYLKELMKSTLFWEEQAYKGRSQTDASQVKENIKGENKNYELRNTAARNVLNLMQECTYLCIYLINL